MPKVHSDEADGAPVRVWWFDCPGCGHKHGFTVGAPRGHPRWTFDGNLEQPTFSPSLLCNPDYPESRCHSFVRAGKIQFLADCWHSLRGQTVEMTEWIGW